MEQEINGKVQKINDEDYEIIKIIETETYPGSVRWYQESYSCELEEAVDAIEAVKKKYGVEHKGLYSNFIDKEDLVLMFDICRLKAPYPEHPELVSDLFKMEPEEWIVYKTGCSNEEAWSASNEAFEEWKRRNLNREPNENNSTSSSSSGCAVTLLIALTSTLSLMFFVL